MIYQAENIQITHEVSPETFKIWSSSITFDITSEAFTNKEWKIHCRVEVPGPSGEYGVYFYNKVFHLFYDHFVDQTLSDHKQALEEDGFSYDKIVSFGNEVIRKVYNTLPENFPFVHSKDS